MTDKRTAAQLVQLVERLRRAERTIRETPSSMAIGQLAVIKEAADFLSLSISRDPLCVFHGDDAEARAAAAQAEIARLRTALREYAHHKVACDSRLAYTLAGTKRPCSCGLAALTPPAGTEPR